MATRRTVGDLSRESGVPLADAITICTENPDLLEKDRHGRVRIPGTAVKRVRELYDAQRRCH